MGRPKIRIAEEQKERLDDYKLIETETYGHVIGRLLDEVESDSQLRERTQAVREEFGTGVVAGDPSE